MKIYLISLLPLFYIPANSQSSLPDNFKIGNYVEIFNNDSIKIYFNCTGTVVDKKCALYYRLGKMDTTIINVAGDFYDYYLNGKVAFKGTMLNNNLEGVAHYYYFNGNVKETGTYKNNFRHGKWTFYYPNGNIQHVYEYEYGQPTVLEAYSKNGKATVVNGNGSFTTEFTPFKQCDKFEASGELINGKKNGKWKLIISRSGYTISTENYVDGKFVFDSLKGNQGSTNEPKIRFTNYYANENLNLLDNSFGCPGISGLFLWEYDDQNIHVSFYPELQEELTKYNLPVNNQWLVVGIQINIKNKVTALNVASSINDQKIENYVYNLISKKKKWKNSNCKRSKNRITYFLYNTS